MCVITEDGVERLFVPGNKVPQFYEGESLKAEKATGPEPGLIPMTVDA